MAEAALLAGRVVLAGVFAAAAAGKLLDRAGGRRAMLGFGVPGRLAPILALVLPALELMLAAALLTERWAALGALGAAVLLVLFSVAIAANLVHGRKPDCHCFGSLHSSPAGPATLARNAALAATAAAVAIWGWQGAGPSALAWLEALSVSGEVAAGAVALLAAVLALGYRSHLRLLRRHGQVLLRMDAMEQQLRAAGLSVEAAAGPAAAEAGLPVGAPAPDFVLPVASGGRSGLDDLLRDGLPVVLVFVSSGCGPCRGLMPRVEAWQRDHAGALRIALVTDAAPEEARATAEEHGIELLLVDAEMRTFELYRGSGTPAAVIVDGDGRVGTPLAAGASGVEQLVRRAAARGVGAVRVGDRLPPLELADLQGAPVGLGGLAAGGTTALLFWNPACGHCREMLDWLKRWEADSPVEAPRLVVVSSGAREETAAEGFRSLVLMDPEFALGRALGVAGTPALALVDGEGRVASPPVAGIEAVLRHLSERAPARVLTLPAA